MNHFILNYLNKVIEFDDPEQLKSQTSEVLQKIGFGKFSYIGFNPPPAGADLGDLAAKTYVNATFVQSTYPREWYDYYVKNDLLYTDPVIQNAKTSFLPYLWDASEAMIVATPQQKKFFKAAEMFGIVRGAVVPSHAPGGEFAIFAMVFDGSHMALQKVWETQKNNLHLMGIYYHAAVWETILKRKTRPTPVLSPRELQCLQWAARGKTLWETSQIIGISQGTVKTHLKAVMRKLETSNKTHAVSKALLHGLINL